MSLVLKRVCEICSEVIPADDALFGDVVVADGKVWIYGPQGSFKSFLTLQMAWALATGGKWLHWEASRKVRVLYIQAEIPRKNFQKRVIALQEAYGDANENLYLAVARGWALDGGKAVAEVQGLVRETGAQAVIYDPVTQLFSGSENSDEDCRFFTRSLEKIGEPFAPNNLGTAVHHSRKGLINREGNVVDGGIGENRGHTHLVGWPDTILRIKPTQEQGQIVVSFDKVRNEAPPQSIYLTFDPIDYILKVSEGDPTSAVQTLLAAGPLALHDFDAYVMEHLDIGQHKVRVMRLKLLEAGVIKEVRNPMNRRQVLLDLVERGG